MLKGDPASLASRPLILTRSLLAKRPGLFWEYSTNLSWWLLLSEPPLWKPSSSDTDSEASSRSLSNSINLPMPNGPRSRSLLLLRRLARPPPSRESLLDRFLLFPRLRPLEEEEDLHRGVIFFPNQFCSFWPAGPSFFATFFDLDLDFFSFLCGESSSFLSLGLGDFSLAGFLAFLFSLATSPFSLLRSSPTASSASPGARDVSPPCCRPCSSSRLKTSASSCPPAAVAPLFLTSTMSLR